MFGGASVEVTFGLDIDATGVVCGCSGCPVVAACLLVGCFLHFFCDLIVFLGVIG